MTNATNPIRSETSFGVTPRWRLGPHDRILVDGEISYVPSSQDEFGHVLPRLVGWKPSVCFAAPMRTWPSCPSRSSSRP